MSFWNIDSDIPVPQKDSRPAGRKPKYPFREMKVGDSVFFDGATSSSNCAIAAHNHGRRHGSKFSVRAEGSGVRIWRIA